MNEIRLGDCSWATEDLPDGCVDLIVTSPPYAMQRKGTYGGVPEEEYVDWFCLRADEFERVLSLRGSFILNIKEHSVDGERSDYVYRLVLALRDRGWRLVDELIWHKKNPIPGAYKGRFKDGFERLYHFTPTKDHYIDKDAVRQPAKQCTLKRYAAAEKKVAEGGGIGRTENASGSGLVGRVEYQVTREYSRTGSGFTKNREAEKTWETALPSNVIHCAAETRNRGHSAVFPSAIPTFFIKCLCPPGGVVYDPFAGSGTTLLAARGLGRQWLGVEINEDYVKAIRKRMEEELV